MIPSKKCIDLIKSFEGCVLKAYPDPGPTGLPVTIGWGSTMYKDGTKIKLGEIITQAAADDLLSWEVGNKATVVNGLLKGAVITQGQFDALVSFAYNVGIGNLATSTLLKLTKDGKDGSGEFAKWNRAAGKVLGGLTRRRAAERDLYLS